MMLWNGSGLAGWQAGLMWAAVIVFWSLLIWIVYAVITNRTHRPGKGA